VAAKNVNLPSNLHSSVSVLFYLDGYCAKSMSQIIVKVWVVLEACLVIKSVFVLFLSLELLKCCKAE
jgi:hypothetical protein